MAYIDFKNIYKVYGNKFLAVDDFNLEIAEKEFVAFIGPSGCGKSTMLRMIAGLEEITAGELWIDGVLVNNVHSKNRHISMVFQNYALYPHLTVYENIAFGLKLQKMPKDEIKKQVQVVAEMLNITEQLQKTPSEMSGGQRQRVALGRAMVQNPKIFLMDEPLSNLDAKLRNKMRLEILKLHKEHGVVTIYVTHDQVEAMTMADKIVVLNEGVIQQIGTPLELYVSPANLFVATFIGEPEINLFNGTVKGDTVIIDNNAAEDDTVNDDNNIVGLDVSKYEDLSGYEGKEITLGIRPEHVRIATDGSLSATIDLTEMRGDTQVLIATFAGKDLDCKTDSAHLLRSGDEINFYFDMQHIHLFDKDTGLRIK